MEEPDFFDQTNIRSRKLEILNNLKKYTPGEVEANTVLGQYEGYTAEPNVAPNSQTPTYARARFEVNTKTWKGVPFIITAGKKT